MAKGVYVCLIVLLVMTSFASASVSIERDYPGYCQSWSGAFHGPCFDDDDCNDTCVLDDHARFGVCDWSSRGLACFCYNPC
ncbi:hypothetical protein SUGI_0027440 [Cryptomeria japonica]|nr:hypothetical protein SUGI_0027440 [Cryptomeria japonica]